MFYRYQQRSPFAKTYTKHNNLTINDVMLNLAHVYNTYAKGFEKIGLGFESFSDIIEFLLNIGFSCQNVTGLIDSKVKVLITPKKYFNKFKKLIENLLILNNNVVIIKLEEFEINIEENLLNKLKIFDIYIHEEHDYEGYLMKHMADHFQAILGRQPIPFRYKIRYDLVFCCSLNAVSLKESLTLVEDAFSKNGIKTVNTLSIKNNSKYMDDERTDMIEKSKMVVFVLNEDYLKSIEFKNDFNHTKEKYMPFIFLLLEPINLNEIGKEINLEQINVIELYKSENILKGEMFYRMSYFVYSLLDKPDLISYENDNVHLQDVNKVIAKPRWSPFEDMTPRKVIKEEDVHVILDFKENNHLLVFLLPILCRSYCKLRLKIYDRNSFDLIRCIAFDLKGSLSIFAYINKHLNYLCIISHNLVYCYDKSYNLIKKVSFERNDKSENIEHSILNDYIYVQYKPRQNVIQVYDQNLVFNKEVNLDEYDKRSSSVCSMNALNNCLYVFLTQSIVIFDLDMNLITVIDKSLNAGGRYNIMRCMNLTNQLYVYYTDKSRNKNLKVFNCNGCKFFDTYIPKISFHDKKTSVTKTLRISNNYLFEPAEMKLTIYDLENSSSTVILPNQHQYYCQLISPKPHLLVNSYKLPCGNLACLKCIYDNYNFYTNRFVCYTETCKDEHCLNHQMEPSSIIKDNLMDICKMQIQHFKDMKDLSKFKDETVESLNLIFDYIYDELEIRVESIKISIDENSKKTINNLEKFKHSFLVRTNSKPDRKKAKMYRSEDVKFDALLSNCLENYPFTMFEDINCDRIGQIVFYDINDDSASSDTDMSFLESAWETQSNESSTNELDY